MWYCSFFLVVHSLSMAPGKKYMTLSEKGFLRWVTCCYHGFYIVESARFDFIWGCVRLSTVRLGSKIKPHMWQTYWQWAKSNLAFSNQVYYCRQYCSIVDFTQDLLDSMYFQSSGFLGTQFFPIWASFFSYQITFVILYLKHDEL